MKSQYYRLLIIITLTTGLFQTALAQQIEVVTSKPDYNIGSTAIHKIIGHDSAGFYILKYHNSRYYIEKLDKELNLMLEEPLKLYEGLKTTYEFQTVVHFSGELLVFVSLARSNEVILYYQKIDKNNLRPASDWIYVATIKYLKGNWPDFYFTYSRQEKKLMIACQMKLYWSKVLSYELYVFNENLELEWRSKDFFNYEGLGPRENHYLVDEFGNVSILSLQKRENLSSLWSDKRNIYTIYRWTGNGKVFKEYSVTLGERYIRGIRIIGGAHGELVCAGFYSEIFRKGMRGTFFFRIDPNDGEIYDRRLNPFDDALFSRFMELDEPTMDKNEEIIQYVFTDMVLRGNDKIMLIAEQFFDQPYDTYNNIIITCYDTTGNVYWNQVIEKRQNFNFRSLDRIRTFHYQSLEKVQVEHSGYRDYIMETGEFYPEVENYCSYALMAPLDETGIMLFFNDDIRNMDQSDKRKNFNRPRKSYILAVMVDEYGNISSQPVQEYKKKGLPPEPIRFYDTRYNCIVIPSFKGYKFNYNKITARF